MGLHQVLVFSRVISLSIVFFAPAAFAGVDLETEDKANALVHISKFVTWPSLEKNKVRLCLSSDSPVMAFKNMIVESPIGDARSLEVKTDSNQTDECDLLFFDDAYQLSNPSLLEETHSGLMTVTDVTGGFEIGILHFLSIDQKLCFAINKATLAKTSLRIDSQLLRLAKRLK